LTFQSTGEDSGNQEMVSLHFYNPLFTPVMDMNGNKWSLAADFTMPLAMLASHTQPLFRTRWTALLNPGKTARPKRLYLMEPYSPDRIPIIMVHGLRSTPLAWAQLTNELMGDPEIRRHYQIWHYLYPTGLPLVASAADFRDELESVRTLLDPEGRDFAMQNMVVIGHSMGGLLARTLVTDSGDAIWNSTFAMPMSGLPPGLDQTPALHRLFYFQAKPYVKRVIFVAVPHHGSEVADSLLARLLARQVELPSALQDFVAHLQTSMPQLFKADDSARFDRGYHNGIRTLSPKDDSLMAMAKLPVNSSIPFHSIMGDRGRGGGAKSSDGIVTYASAHLPGASSELIVPSNHSTYENPQALAEVKRILKLHLEQSKDGHVGP
jgi:pimeloyl-ACP methyl ester carboxylesterase